MAKQTKQKTADDDVKLTTEQRLRALERADTVLHDEVKILHRLIRQVREQLRDHTRSDLAT